MKNITKIKIVIIEGIEHTLFRFDAENEHERYFGERPFGCIDNAKLDHGRATRAFNGLELNVAETAERSISQATTTIKIKKWKAEHPNASELELLQYVAAI